MFIVLFSKWKWSLLRQPLVFTSKAVRGMAISNTGNLCYYFRNSNTLASAPPQNKVPRLYFRGISHFYYFSNLSVFFNECLLPFVPACLKEFLIPSRSPNKSNEKRLFNKTTQFLLNLTSRRQTGCCFRQVWSLFFAAELPKSRAALTLAHLAAKAARSTGP